MLFNTLCTILISLITIFVLHYLYEYFKKNLTSPKIKDLINKPKTEYENIYKIINNSDITENNNTSDNNIEKNKIISENNIDKNSKIDSNMIKNELKDFFNDLNNNRSNNQMLNNESFNNESFNNEAFNNEAFNNKGLNYDSIEQSSMATF